jgi:hypothetical protein
MPHRGLTSVASLNKEDWCPVGAQSENFCVGTAYPDANASDLLSKNVEKKNKALTSQRFVKGLSSSISTAHPQLSQLPTLLNVFNKSIKIFVLNKSLCVQFYFQFWL